MASFRSNLIFSTLALVLMGLVRPGFNIVVSQVFGAEVNGRVTTFLSVIFLASLLPTAGLPSVLLLHVSRALGEGRPERARAFARLCLELGLLLALVAGGIAANLGALGYGPSPSPVEQVLLFGAVLVYSHARLARNALLAQGLAGWSVRADIAGLVVMLVGCGAFAWAGRPELALLIYAAPYATYTVMTAPRLFARFGDGRLEPADRREVFRYTALWLIAAAASMAGSEIAVLVLHGRASEVIVGEFGVVVSLLTPLGLAPRILETPLLHELSHATGGGDEAKQREFTARALHWVSVLTTPASAAVAILAGPILALAARIHTPEVVDAFAMMVLSFSLDITQMPASNLVSARARPWVAPLCTVVPLVVACATWALWPSGGAFGVAVGLTVTHLVKAACLYGVVRFAYGVVLIDPIKRAVVLGLSVAMTVLARRNVIDPWIAAVAFELVFLALFAGTLRDIVRALRPRRPVVSPEGVGGAAR